MLLPSLTGVVEAASDFKESNTEKIVASQKEKIEEKEKEVQADKAEVKEAKKEVKETKAEVKEEKTKPEAKEDLEDILTEDEIQEIRNRANDLENSYFFNGNMVEELKAELRKAKADPTVNYGEAKARLIEEAILKNEPEEVSQWEDRAADDKITNGNLVVNKFFIDNQTISGKTKLGANRRKNQGKDVVITVTVVHKAGGTEEKTVTIESTNKKSDWSVTLEKKLAVGDKVSIKHVYGGDLDGEIKDIELKELLRDTLKDKLQMPTGTVMIEDTSSGLVDEFEQNDAFELFKTANASIMNDITSAKFGFESGTLKAWYDITYTDGSTYKYYVTAKKEEDQLKEGIEIKKITDHSQSPNIEKTYVADGQITINFDKEIAKGSKIGIVQTIDARETNDFCTDEDPCTDDKCNIKKSTKKWVSVDATSKKITYKIPDNFLEYGKEFGVVVKEHGKLNSCKKTKPVYKIPNVGVRDPKKLTETEKDKIREEIRKANTTANGKSKLPDTYDGIPAIIDFDKDGNVKIISPNYVQGDWDNGTFVPKKNEDGSIKIITGNEDKVIPVKKEELLTNLAPNQPKVSYDKDNGEISVTPDKADTDAKTITVKYKDPEGTEKTETVTKGDDGKWKVVPPESGESKIKVDENTGVVTIKDSDIQNKTNVSATVTDEGGINTVVDNDKDAKKSKNGSETIKIYPKKPEIKVDKKTGSVTITPVDKDGDKVAKKMDITYTPAGEDKTKTVTVERKDDGTWTVPDGSDFKVSEDGKSITITNDKIKSKTNITAKTNDGDTTETLVSNPDTKQVPDKTAPKPPTVEVNTTDGTAHITPPADPDVKTIEVKYPGSNGNEKTFTATKKGPNTWEITGNNGETIDVQSGKITIPYNNLKKADTISATATDEDGNMSTEGIDTSLPPAPTAIESEGVITVTPPENTPAVDGMEITYTPAGSEETKTFKVVKGTDDKWKIDGDTPDGVTVNENGTVTIADGTAKEQTKVTAISSIDTNKKSLEKGEATVPEGKAPEAPEVKVQEGGSVKITPKDKGETTVIVTYKDKDGTAKTATATKGKNGKWTVVGTNGEEINEDSGVITIPEGKTNPGDRVRATASKGSKTSTENNDLTKPAPPTVTPDQTTGNVTIAPPTKGNVDGMIIKYKTPGDTPVERTVTAKKGTDNKWKIEGDNPDGVTVDEGTGVVTIPKGKAKEKTPVTVESTIETLQTPDKNQGERPELVPDKTAPNKPKVELVEASGDITITPPTDKDTTSVTVNYKGKDGTEKAPKAKKDNTGKWTLENNTNGESVNETTGVITLAKGSYKTGEAVTAYGNDNVDNKSDVDNQTPVEVTIDVNGGKQNIAGSILLKGGSYVLPAIYDKQYFPEGKLFDGWKVGNETKKAGDTIKIDANTTVKAIWKDKASDQPGVDKPNTPEAQSPEENEIPGIKIRDHYTPTFPVYVTVPKTEKIEKAEEVPVSLETHKAYIAGYEDNTLRAEGNLTRAEAAAMVTRLAGLDLSDTSMPAFKDMQKNAWYFRYINAAVKAKMLDADNGMMRPNDKITRAEFAKMLAAIDKENSSVSKFDDIKGHRYEKEINKIYGNNRIEGYEDGSFRPDAYLTRAESAAFLNRMFNRIADKEAYAGLEDKLARFKDFDASKWYYDEMVEATNSHELTRRGKASDKFGRVYEKWTRILPSDVK